MLKTISAADERAAFVRLPEDCPFLLPLGSSWRKVLGGKVWNNSGEARVKAKETAKWDM
jgi:hypothetical protein